MISLQEMRGFLDLAPDRDEDIKVMRAEVVDLWERETDRLWDRRVDHDQVSVGRDSDDLRSIWLELWPIETVTSVERRRRGEEDWTLMDVDDWRLDESYPNRIELLDRSLEPLEQTRVVYTGGEADAPPVIKLALRVQARFTMQRHSRELVHVKNQAFQGGSGSFHEAYLHPYFAQMARRERRTLVR